MKINEDMKAILERRRTQNFVFFAIPVEKLYGNLFMDYEGLSFSLDLKDSATYSEFISSLKSYRLNSKNYAQMFVTKARVMVSILHCIVTRFEEKLFHTYKFYEHQVQFSHKFEVIKYNKDIQDLVVDYQSSLSEFKRYRDFKLEDLQALKNLLLNSETQENNYVKMIEREIQMYLNSMSKMIRGMAETPKLVASFANLETNCFVQEFHMLVLFEAFRRWLLKTVVSVVYQSFNEFQDFARQFEDLFKKLEINFRPAFSSEDPLSSMIDKSYKRFIKKKINLQQKFIISDQVLLEFFQEGYPITYNSSTFLCKKYYLCTVNDKESKKSPVIMVIDV